MKLNEVINSNKGENIEVYEVKNSVYFSDIHEGKEEVMVILVKNS